MPRLPANAPARRISWAAPRRHGQALFAAFDRTAGFQARTVVTQAAQLHRVRGVAGLVPQDLDQQAFEHFALAVFEPADNALQHPVARRLQAFGLTLAG